MATPLGVKVPSPLWGVGVPEPVQSSVGMGWVGWRLSKAVGPRRASLLLVRHH